MSPPSSTIPTGATKKRRRKKASKPTEKDFDTFCANMPLMQKISAAFVCMGLRIMFFWMVVSAIINATPALFVEHITTCVSSITAQAVATPGALTAAVIGDAPFSLLATVLADAAAPLVSCVATLVDDVVFGGDAAVEFVHIAALVTLGRSASLLSFLPSFGLLLPNVRARVNVAHSHCGAFKCHCS
jgi:hypothetical protein